MAPYNFYNGQFMHRKIGLTGSIHNVMTNPEHTAIPLNPKIPQPF